MKKIVTTVLILLFLIGAWFYQGPITSFILTNFVYKNQVMVGGTADYQKKFDYAYVKRTDSLYPTSKKEIINLFYSALNKGMTKFSYYCEKKYQNCVEDSKSLIDDQIVISSINNFVHPYHSFNRLFISINNYGKVDVEIEYLYQENQINQLNQKMDQIIASELKEDMSNRDKIKAIHDYIINHTVYDVNRNEYYEANKTYRYSSNLAYGALIEGYAICGGYADAMALFLERFGIENYKVASENHIWNLVKLDDKWYHLDLTWDDPVLTNSENILTHNFFLITTAELAKKNTNQHSFDLSIYQEAK